jgi:hypothetical protein
MKKLLFLVLLCCLTTIYAQEKYSLDFGKITKHEINMSTCDFAPDAEAVVLYEIGNDYFHGNYAEGAFELSINKKLKIKILKQSGLQYAEIQIPFREEGRRIEDVQINSATTYNYENNKLTKTELDKKNIFRKKINQNLWEMTFAMPNVRESSIIEIEYTIRSPFLFNIPIWDFQHNIPVIYSKLEINIIPYYEYIYLMKGATKFDEYYTETSHDEISFYDLKYREMKHTFIKKNIPAFKYEDFITSPNDYRISIHFQLAKIHNPRGGIQEIMTTWAKICNEYLKSDDFGKYVKAMQKEAKKILPSLVTEEMTDEEKIKVITNYVKSNFKWNDIYSRFAREKLANVLKNKSGNVAELNLLLLGLLNAAGIDAKPILLSTRQNGMIDKRYPFEKFFNYVIVMATADSNDYLLDATEPMLAFDVLPVRCVNVHGLVVAKNSELWIEIAQGGLSGTIKTFDIKLSDDLNTLKANVKYQAHIYDAFEYRQEYAGDDKGFKEYLEGNDIKEIDNLKIENYNNLDSAFVFSFQTEMAISKTAEKLFILPFLNQVPQNNIFKQRERTLPVDMLYVFGDTYISHIEIPEGYKIESLPQEINYNGKQSLLIYKAAQNGNSIDVVARYQYKKSIFEAKEYSILKKTYNDLIKALSEAIVLIKEDIE